MTVVARSRIRRALVDLLAGGSWESQAEIAAVVADYTGAPIKAVHEAVSVMRRSGSIDIRGRGRRRQVKVHTRKLPV